jgi:hypothetical protein
MRSRDHAGKSKKNISQRKKNRRRAREPGGGGFETTLDAPRR